MEEWIASFNVLTLGPVWAYIVKGTLFTVIISTVSVILSIIIGAVLALVRNYCNAPRYLIFKWLASLYIEVFRNTPLLLWIFGLLLPSFVRIVVRRNQNAVQSLDGSDRLYFIRYRRNHSRGSERCLQRTIRDSIHPRIRHSRYHVLHYFAAGIA